MRGVIYYYSGTGNTRLACKYIAANSQVPFEKPSLILTGRQDCLVGYRDAWKLMERYPRSGFVVLDMAGHGLQIEQAVLFNALVNEWLDRVKSKEEKS